MPLLHVFTDAGLSAKDLHRPALQEAIAQLDSGKGEILVAAKLDRLSRSVRDVVALLDHSAKHGWRVLTLDLAIDTTTPFGEAMVAVSAAFAQLERRLIGERTRAALAVTKAQGTRLGRSHYFLPTSSIGSSQSTSGERVGRPSRGGSTAKAFPPPTGEDCGIRAPYVGSCCGHVQRASGDKKNRPGSLNMRRDGPSVLSVRRREELWWREQGIR